MALPEHWQKKSLMMTVYSSIKRICLMGDSNENHNQANVQTEKVEDVQLATNDGLDHCINDTRITTGVRTGCLAPRGRPGLYR